MDININFINRSSALTPNIVIFHPLGLQNPNKQIIAWHVITRCPSNWHHPFIYSTDLEMTVSDFHGNYSPRLKAPLGSMFEAVPLVGCNRGRQFRHCGTHPFSHQVEIFNRLTRDPLNGHIFSRGEILCSSTNIAPGSKAVFKPVPSLCIGTTRQVKQRQVIGIDDIDNIFQFSVSHFTHAHIVMSGGDPGPDSRPIQFILEKS